MKPMTYYNIWVPLGSGFQLLDKLWVPVGSGPELPGPESEPKKWVPVGFGFQVGTQKAGSGGFRVPTKIFFVPTPDLDNFFVNYIMSLNLKYCTHSS